MDIGLHCLSNLELRFLPLFPVRYNVRDLPNDKLYVVTVKLSVCTNSSSCEANHTIFENMLLPKQPCSWDEGFVNTSRSCL